MPLFRTACFAALLSVSAGVALPPAALAEDMSAEDILKRLQAQRTRTLGFVDASKPAAGAQDETATAVTVAPEVPADRAPSGLALAPVDDKDAGAQTTAPGAATAVTGLQPVDGAEATAGIATAPARQPETTATGAAQLAATGGSGDMAPTVNAATDTPESYTIDLTIYFDFDSAVLKASSKTQLNALCQAVKLDTGNGTYQIIGHTDAKGKASYNKRLSQARADEVVRYMVTKCGIDTRRLKAVGAGEEQLRYPEDPRNDENRRVEIQVLS